MAVQVELESVELIGIGHSQEAPVTGPERGRSATLRTCKEPDPYTPETITRFAKPWRIWRRRPRDLAVIAAIVPLPLLCQSCAPQSRAFGMPNPSR